MKAVCRGKYEFYSFYNDDIIKDGILFRKTQSSIEIDVTVVKKHVFLNVVERYMRLT